MLGILWYVKVRSRSNIKVIQCHCKEEPIFGICLAWKHFFKDHLKYYWNHYSRKLLICHTTSEVSLKENLLFVIQVEQGVKNFFHKQMPMSGLQDHIMTQVNKRTVRYASLSRRTFCNCQINSQKIKNVCINLPVVSKHLNIFFGKFPQHPSSCSALNFSHVVCSKQLLTLDPTLAIYHFSDFNNILFFL